MRRSFVEKLKSILGPDRVLSDGASRLLYSYDGALERKLPGAVALPRDAEQVAACVRLAADAGVPYVARGAGTNLCGGSVPADGGLVIHLAGLNRILSIDPDRKRAWVEPGVVNAHLNRALAPFRIFYAPDPASMKACTLGGNVGTNAGGPHCLKYGVTTNHISGLELVLPDGSRLKTSVDEDGYDLTALFVGSEGTLGIVTALEAALLPVPEDVRTLLVSFPSLETAAQTVTDVTSAGVVPATLEFMDRLTLGAVEAFVKAGYPTDVDAVLLVETDGVGPKPGAEMDRVREFCVKNGGWDLRLAANEAEREKLWEGRRGSYAALARLAPNVMVEDGVVPPTRLPEAVRRVRAIAARENLTMGLIAHAGDGNLHPNIAFDERDSAAAARVREAGHEMLRVCVELGGSISGEHGIGVEKREAMRWLFTPETLRLFRRVKDAFDSDNLCNPDKLIPALEAPPPVIEDKWIGGSGEGRVRARDAGHVQDVLRAASASGHPVFICGLGTRKLRAPEGAITLELHALNRLLSHDVDNFTAVVEAGCPVATLSRLLAEKGRYAAVAGGGTMGGLLASGGPSGARLRDHVMRVKAVLSTGEVVTVGAPVLKSVAGYDLAKLFIGAWGTLGAVLEVTLRTLPAPSEAAPRKARPDAAALSSPAARRLKRAFDPADLFVLGNPHER